MNNKNKDLLNRLWNSPTLTTWGQLGTRSLSLFLVTPLVFLHYDKVTTACYFLFGSLIAIAFIIPRKISQITTRLVAFAASGATSLSISIPNRTEKKNSGLPNWFLIEQIHANSGLLFLFTGITIVVVVGVLGYYGLSNLVTHYPNSDSIWRALVYLCIGTFCQTLFLRSFAFLRGFGLIAVTNRWDILFNCISISVTAYMISRSVAIDKVILSQQLVLTGVGIRNFFLFRAMHNGASKSYRWYGYCVNIWNEIRNPLWKGLCRQISSLGVLQLSGVILAGLAVPEHVASYFLAVRVITSVASVAQAPFSSNLPLFSRLWAEGDSQRLYRLYKTKLVLVLWINMLGSLSIGVCYAYFLRATGSDSVFIPISTWVLLCNLHWQDRYITLSTTLIECANRVPYFSRELLAGIGSLALISPFWEIMGLSGVFCSVWGTRVVLFHFRPILDICQELRESVFQHISFTYFPVLGGAMITSAVIYCIGKWLNL